MIQFNKFRDKLIGTNIADWMFFVWFGVNLLGHYKIYLCTTSYFFGDLMYFTTTKFENYHIVRPYCFLSVYKLFGLRLYSADLKENLENPESGSGIS